MKPRIDEALDYLGGSDHRYQTTLVGGLLLLVAQYAFIYARPLSPVTCAVGVVAAVALVGYLVVVVRYVTTGHDKPPRFVPLTRRRLASLGFNGLIGFGLVVTVLVGMSLPLNAALSEIQNRTGPVGTGTPQTQQILLVTEWLTYAYVFLVVPFVLVAVLLLFGSIRWSWIVGLLDRESDTTVTTGAVAGVERSLSRLGPLVRQYVSAWMVALVLLLFNTDAAFFVSNVIFDRQVFEPQFDTGTTISALFSFSILVSLSYLFSTAVRDISGPTAEESDFEQDTPPDRTGR